METPTKIDRIRTIIVFLLLLGTGCSSTPGKSYNVKIVSITKMAAGPYCTYAIESPTNTCLPRDFFVETCDKHQVGDELVIEMASDSQWKSCQ
jgi:hypothetical protein